MKKKGFTLIELLAVIIILAVIALIATPIVLDVIESTKRSAFESGAYGVIDAVKLKTMEDRLEGTSLSKEYTFPSKEIEVQGKQPNGSVVVDNEGRISIAIYDGKWCATKSYLEGIITITEYVEGECELPFVLLGDINGDGKVTALEYNGCKSIISGTTVDNGTLTSCDVDQNGIVNQKDVDLLKNYFFENVEIENIFQLVPINPNIKIEYSE